MEPITVRPIRPPRDWFPMSNSPGHREWRKEKNSDQQRKQNSREPVTDHILRVPSSAGLVKEASLSQFDTRPSRHESEVAAVLALCALGDKAIQLTMDVAGGANVKEIGSLIFEFDEEPFSPEQ